MDESIDRASTLSIEDVALLERMHDEASGKFHGDIRLARADLRRARRLKDMDLVAPGRLSDKHFALTDKGVEFVVGVRRGRSEHGGQ